ncbi:MAG: hypothetical protein R3D00_09015 [Bacteroidia bacterium]
MIKNLEIAQILRWTARVWGILSLAFLLFMIGGHIFGDEPQNFNNNREIVSLIFFPGGVLAGLLIGFRSEKWGGIIAAVSMAVFFVMAPNALSTAWFWLIAAPAVWFLAYWFFFGRKIVVNKFPS